MSRPARVRFSPGYFLGVLVVSLFAAVLYSRGVRRVALGNEFRYVPRESVLLVATGEIESLWQGVEGHFGRALRAGEGGGPLGQLGALLAEFVDESKQAELPVATAADLVGYGLDVRRGVVLSAYRVWGDDHLLAVLPVADRDALIKSFDALSKAAITGPEAGGPAVAGVPVYQQDDIFMAFPDAHTAVVTDSAELLERSLTLTEQNLAHATNNDALYRAVRRVARGPLMVGPTVFVFWQSRTAPFAERSGMLRLGTDEIKLECNIELSGGTLRMIDDLRAPSLMPEDWATRLPADVMAAAVLQDDQLETYQRFLGEHLVDRWLPRLRGAVELPRARRILVALTDIEDGLPDLLVGLWGERPDLETALVKMQRELRRSRDSGLLRAAMAKYRELGQPLSSLADLQRSQLIGPERYPLFDRYPLLPNGIGNPEYRDSDFQNELYETEIQGHRVRFLMPPVTTNDLKYRPDLKGADPATLATDRYRMASVFLDDSLWIATDLRDLEALIAKAPGKDAGRQAGDRFSAVRRDWPRGAKVKVYVDLDRLISLGQLNPGSEIDKLVQAGLRDLQGYQVFEAYATPSVDLQRLEMSARLRRRAPE